ncbi:MAG: chorismate synthase [Elusimicrobia bacterium]|nr:chorismate synthase [Elusimicrobiota bacterium]
MFRLLTAGESHGPALCGIIEGLPAGLKVSAEDIDRQLARRQAGYGRGARMSIETDRAQILAGVRGGRTLGSPLALLIPNKDRQKDMPVLTVPRPGHADLAGSLKYGHADLRDTLERASARETAMRVALAVPARLLLAEFGARVSSRVVSIGGETDGTDPSGLSPARWERLVDASPVRCLDPGAGRRMTGAIDAAKAAGDTVGGVFEVRVWGLPPGLGSHVHWDRRLDGDLGAALMALNGIKAMEIGSGWGDAGLRGSEVHDALFWDKSRSRLTRKTNRAGGLEGGTTNGEALVLRAAMKPLASLAKPLVSVDLRKRRAAPAPVIRSDVCAVPAAGVIAESLAALELADAFLLKLGGDSIKELRSHYEASLKG